MLHKPLFKTSQQKPPSTVSYFSPAVPAGYAAALVPVFTVSCCLGRGPAAAWPPAADGHSPGQTLATLRVKTTLALRFAHSISNY